MASIHSVFPRQRPLTRVITPALLRTKPGKSLALLSSVWKVSVAVKILI